MAAEGQLLQPGHKPADPLRVSGHRAGPAQTWRIMGSIVENSATGQHLLLVPHLLQPIAIEDLRAHERAANRKEREYQAQVRACMSLACMLTNVWLNAAVHPKSHFVLRMHRCADHGERHRTQ
jgi:hypothetical protein